MYIPVDTPLVIALPLLLGTGSYRVVAFSTSMCNSSGRYLSVECLDLESRQSFIWEDGLALSYSSDFELAARYIIPAGIFPSLINESVYRAPEIRLTSCRVSTYSALQVRIHGKASIVLVSRFFFSVRTPVYTYRIYGDTLGERLRKLNSWISFIMAVSWLPSASNSKNCKRRQLVL